MSKSEVFLHPQSLCESNNIGLGSRIWAFAHILPGAKIGVDANICDHTFIENEVVIGDRVTVKCHVAIWDGITIGDDVFIGPGVSFTNDKYPRSRHYLDKPLKTRICRGASIGAGSVILPGITVGESAMIAAGAVVSRDVAPFTLVMGNPAKQKGMVCVCGAKLVDEGGGMKCSRGNWRGEKPHLGMRCNYAS